MVGNIGRPLQLVAMSFRVSIAFVLAAAGIVLVSAQGGPGDYFGTYRGSFFRRTASPADSATWYLPGPNGDCDSIPAQVNSGTPDICALSNAGEERCICIKLDGYGVYLPHCGKCVDPCALRFIPNRRFPRRKNAKLTEAQEAFLKTIE